MTAVGVDRAKLYKVTLRAKLYKVTRGAILYKVTFDQRSMFSPTTVYYYLSMLICNLDFISLLFSLLPIFISNQQVDPGKTNNICIYLVVAHILYMATYD